MSTRDSGLGETPAGGATNRRTFGQSVATALLLLLLAGIIAKQAQAHGGGTIRLTAAAVGPYLLTAWVSPQEVRAGQELHVTAAVELDGEPILDAEVLIQVTQADTGAHFQSAVATRDQSVNKLLYEADLTIQEPGAYRINITVSGSDGQGTSAFDIEVRPATGINWWLILPLAFVVAAVIAWYRRRKQSPGK